MYSGAIMIINPDTYINFTGNRAKHKGSAIYVHDKGYYHAKSGTTQCFFLPKRDSQHTLGEIHFQDNHARSAGSALYGGSVDTCILNRNRRRFKGNRFFFKMTHFQIDENSKIELSLISSDATRVCICIGSHPDCTVLNYTLAAYPGQTALINAVAVGQGFGTSPASNHSQHIP